MHASSPVSTLILIEQLRAALTLPLPGRDAQERMAGRVRPLPDAIPQDARPSAVLALLFPKEEDLHLLLMQRVQDGRAHGGQISFPGGKQEPSDADLRATALREANEEVGVMSADVEILGALSPLYIPISNFQVYPFVGFSQRQPEYNLSTAEVEQVLEVKLSELFTVQSKIVTTVRPSSAPNLSLTVPAYKLQDDTIIWGATAMMLSELEAVLEGLAP